jgi:hypothetical protein
MACIAREALTFEGTLCHLDLPSELRPSLAGVTGRAHNTAIPLRVGLDGLRSLLDKPLYTSTFQSHKYKYECGRIVSARIVSGPKPLVQIQGFIFDGIEQEIRDQVAGFDEPGMSCEMDVDLDDDLDSEIWTATAVTWTGALLCERSIGAYQSSSFRLRRP